MGALGPVKWLKALPWSCGTIGFLTSVTVKLLRTKPFIKMTYISTSTTKKRASDPTQLWSGRRT